MLKSALLAAAWLCVIAGSAAAQPGYPNRTVRIVVPATPGGGSDLFARLAAQRLASVLGQQFVVDNKPGGGTLVGMDAVLHSPPDGHMLYLSPSTTTSMHVARKSMPYDVTKVFVPVTQLVELPQALIIHPSVAAQTTREFIALARREPGKLSIGTSPPGSGSHLSAELFKARTGIDVTFVPYKGAAALNNDLIGGHIPAVFSVLPASLGAIRAGHLKVLAMTGTARIPILPDVPTVAETIPGFEAVLRYGLLVPAGTPQPVIARLNKELQALAGSPEVQERINNEAGSAMTSTSAEYAAEIVREDALWGPLIRGLNIKVE
jgi:tripartite-type tricarboxylate transporter receptor subunit TctC